MKLFDIYIGLPCNSEGEVSACNSGEPGWSPGLGTSLENCRREWQSTPVFLPGESHHQRTVAGYSPWGRKESEMIEQLKLLTTTGHCKGASLVAQ